MSILTIHGGARNIKRGVQSLSRSNAVPSTVFGLTHLGVNYSPAPAVTYGPQRMWDSWAQDPGNTSFYGSPTWTQIHTSSGNFSWTLFDLIVNNINGKGKLDLIYTFGYKPSWVAAAGTAGFYTAWSDFVTAIVTRAAGKITAWGLWNEPNASGTNNLSDTILAQMAIIAYPIIKGIQPLSIVLSPEYVGNGAGALTNFCAAGAANYFDAVGVHLYTKPDPTASAVNGGTQAIITAYKSVMANYNIQTKPIWNTEFAEYGISGFSGTLPENERDFISQMLPLLWVSGVDRSYYYAWDGQASVGNPIGRLWADADGSQTANKNVAAVAWDIVQGWISGAVMSGTPTLNGKTYSVPLTKSGLTGNIVWNFGGKAYLTIPAATFTRAIKADGTILSIASTRTIIEIGNTAYLIDNGAPGAVAELKISDLNPLLLTTAGAITSAGWSNPGVTYQTAQPDVNLGTTAIKVLETTANSFHGLVVTIAKASSVITYTLIRRLKVFGRDWIRIQVSGAAYANARIDYVNLTTGEANTGYGYTGGTGIDVVANSFKAVPIGNGFYEVSISVVSDATAQLIIQFSTSTAPYTDSFVGDVTKGFIDNGGSLYAGL